jgi:hypothetical protein
MLLREASKQGNYSNIPGMQLGQYSKPISTTATTSMQTP